MYILFNNPHFNRTTVIKMVGKCVESIEEKKSVDGEKITLAQSLFKMLQNLDYDLQILLQETRPGAYTISSQLGNRKQDGLPNMVDDL